MTKIYALKQEQQELLDALYWYEEEEEAKKRLHNIHGQVEAKIRFLSGVLAEAIAQAQQADEALKIATDRLKKQKNRADKVEQRLRDFILSTLIDFDIKKVSGDLLNVSHYERDSVQKTESFDVLKLPDEFIRCKTTIEPEMREIEKALKEGVELPGLCMVKKEVLRVS